MAEEAKRPPSPLEMLRDKRALVDTGLGPVAFVTVNALTDLDTAAIVAVATSVVIAIFRAIRREPLTNAIGGLLGTGLAVFLALRTGSASGYFVPRRSRTRASRSCSRAPWCSGARWSASSPRRCTTSPPTGIATRSARRVYAEVTLVWATCSRCARSSTRSSSSTDREGALAATAVVLGWPAFLGLVWFSYRYVPYRFKQLGVEHAPRER